MKPKLYFEVLPDKRRIKDNGCYPLRLRISQNKQRWYFPIGFESSEELYGRAYEPKPRNDAKELRARIEAIKREAEEVCNKLSQFSPDSFRKEFFHEAIISPQENKTDVFSVFQNYIQELRNEERISTAKSYECAMLSLAAYSNGMLLQHRQSKTSGVKKDVPKFKKIKFEDITIKWLKSYASELESVGTSNATIGIYCRSLRAVYNYAMKKDDSLTTSYPFGKGKFEIPTAAKNKRALSLADIKSIFNYVPQTDTEQKAKDIWIFSYLCNGVNIADIIRLKYSQLKFHSEGCTLTFLRQKTQRKSNKTEIAVELDIAPTEYLKQIIDRHGHKNKDGFIFPFLSKNLGSQEQFKVKASLIRLLNKSLSKIANNLNLQINLTTYVARHSYATVLLRSGVSVAAISEALGHSDIKTTENYLGGFSSESKRQNSTNLLNF